MDYLYQYLLFLAQAVTLVVSLLLILAAVMTLGNRRHTSTEGHLEIDKLNEQLLGYQQQLEHTVLTPTAFKKARKLEAKKEKQRLKSEGDSAKKDGEEPVRRKLFVVEFDGDVNAARADHLRDEISAILTVAKSSDEVVLRLNSPGGLVHGYGFAASQLVRIKDQGVKLTVSVDKVAASGGYLMAAVGDKILAAPFALLGSIGVVAQVPNVHRLLKKNDVDVDVMTAGKYKRTLTMFGENTDEGRRKFQEELEDVHQLFQSFLQVHRPNLDMETVATGEAWYGEHAIKLGLIDELSTSDAYLNAACAEADVYKVHWVEKKKPLDRVLDQVQNAVIKTVQRLFSIPNNQA